MVNIIPKGEQFYPTDHCGIMQVDENIINPRYMAYMLNQEGKTAGFSRTIRASLDRIKNLTIYVPSIELQNEKMDEVKIIERKINELELSQIDLSNEISKAISRYII